MTKYVEWQTPFCFKEDGPYTIDCINRVKASDIIAWQRWREPRYTDDETALADFCVVHWAAVVDIDDAL